LICFDQFHYIWRAASACYGYEERGIYIAAASDSMWENGAACGKLYSVACIGATNRVAPPPCKNNFILVLIVDYCPPGCHGNINLSEDAFFMIADLNAGKIMVNYTEYI
jgi:hypothetical protein